MTTETSLYRHFDKGGSLLYVGISLSAVERLNGHANSKWASEIARVEIERFPTRGDALNAERNAIRDERPIHNVVHNNQRRISAMGGRIRAMRTARGMTLQQLADCCGVTRAAVSQWELGVTLNIRLPALLCLLDTLETTLPELLGEAA